jgi:geranylgeranyl diphosphate synthase, type II
VTPGFEHVEATLAGYAELTRTAMDEFFIDGQPTGHLYDLVREYPGRGGKGIRPSLLLAACQAYGGAAREGLGPAVALEMMHNAFLIHDDLEDASPTRRGEPTLHELHGVGLAVNAGDALACMALQPLRDDGLLGTRVAQRVLDEFLTMVRVTTEGQAMELGWRRHNAVDLAPADYLSLTGKKTCWYTTVSPLRVGAIVGSRGTAPLEGISRFGFYLGVAFQIRDDLLNLDGSDEAHGEELLADIREGKRTLMLLHLLDRVTGPQRDWLVDFLAAPEAERAQRDAEQVLALMEAYGSLEFARQYGDGIAAAASDAFDDAFAGLGPSPHVTFIRSLIPYMLARSL